MNIYLHKLDLQQAHLVIAVVKMILESSRTLFKAQSPFFEAHIAVLAHLCWLLAVVRAQKQESPIAMHILTVFMRTRALGLSK